MRLDENLAVQPDLADSMPTTSSDGKTVTVKIRGGVKFHNGDALTSADVKYTFDRIIDPKNAAVARSFFGDVDTITASDPTTVVFNLKTPNAALIAYMAHPNTGIVSKKIGEANADLSKKETAIGSGPFKLVEWVPDNYMRFEANKDYYVSGQPSPARAIARRPSTPSRSAWTRSPVRSRRVSPATPCRRPSTRSTRATSQKRSSS